MCPSYLLSLPQLDGWYFEMVKAVKAKQYKPVVDEQSTYCRKVLSWWKDSPKWWKKPKSKSRRRSAKSPGTELVAGRS